MTMEQDVYKLLKYLSQNKESKNVEELERNKFVYSKIIDFNIEEYEEYDRYAHEKNIYIDFNIRSVSWNTHYYDYSNSKNIERRGYLNWNQILNIIYPILKQELMDNITYKLLKAETERTQKARQLRAKCIMDRELNTINELAI